ncbi:MAG: hypothetical protein Q8L91_02435 [Polaromonas sp.]|nr:hypothetical protein [Polaromonas sp.]
MNARIRELLARSRQIEEDIELELRQRRAALHADFENRRVRFEEEVLAQQRRFRTGLLAYVLGADWRHAATAPIIYSLIAPLLVLDLFLIIYQSTCFPLYGIAPVRRRDYLEFDRAHLGYLNLLEKLNCAYCSYATGLAAYLREVVGRTEQYWCPIKHARRQLQAHPYYAGFADYGDAHAYRQGLQALRAELAGLEAKKRA